MDMGSKLIIIILILLCPIAIAETYNTPYSDTTCLEGTCRADVSTYPKNYLDKHSKWQKVNMTISNDCSTFGLLCVKDNYYQMNLAPSLSTKFGIGFKLGQYNFSYSPAGMYYTDELGNTQAVASPNIKIPLIKDNMITYTDIYPGINLQLQYTPLIFQKLYIIKDIKKIIPIDEKIIKGKNISVTFKTILGHTDYEFLTKNIIWNKTGTLTSKENFQIPGLFELTQPHSVSDKIQYFSHELQKKNGEIYYSIKVPIKEYLNFTPYTMLDPSLKFNAYNISRSGMIYKQNVLGDPYNRLYCPPTILYALGTDQTADIPLAQDSFRDFFTFNKDYLPMNRIKLTKMNWTYYVVKKPLTSRYPTINLSMRHMAGDDNTYLGNPGDPGFWEDCGNGTEYASWNVSNQTAGNTYTMTFLPGKNNELLQDFATKINLDMNYTYGVRLIPEIRDGARDSSRQMWIAYTYPSVYLSPTWSIEYETDYCLPPLTSAETWTINETCEFIDETMSFVGNITCQDHGRPILHNSIFNLTKPFKLSRMTGCCIVMNNSRFIIV